jgi:uncharacterized membrane protein
VLVVFLVLLVLANEFTDGERFYGVAPIVVTGLALLGLFGVHRATVESRAWRVNTRRIAVMTIGTAVHVLLAYVFNSVLEISVGPVVVQPQICVPILLGYAFGPVVGFFSGSVGSLLGDFVTGWGVFPAWHIGTGVTGLVPGLVAALTDEKHDSSSVSPLVIGTIAVTAGIIFVHPRAPEPWTGEVQDFSFWAWALLIGGGVMIANSVLLEEISVDLAAVNLWGTLGILAGNAFASLAHIWINEYSLATAVVGEFAPAAATDILNLIVFTPIVLVAYRAIRRRTRG